MSQAVWLATAGGCAVNVLQLVEYGKRPKLERPDFKDPLFYVPYLAWPLLGALLAYVYAASGVKLSPILALNVGLSAPLILRAMVEVAPIKPRPIDPGGGA